MCPYSGKPLAKVVRVHRKVPSSGRLDLDLSCDTGELGGLSQGWELLSRALRLQTYQVSSRSHTHCIAQVAPACSFIVGLLSVSCRRASSSFAAFRSPQTQKLAGLNRCTYSVGGFLAESETVTQLRRIPTPSILFCIDHQHIQTLRLTPLRSNRHIFTTTTRHLLANRGAVISRSLFASVLRGDFQPSIMAARAGFMFLVCSGRLIFWCFRRSGEEGEGCNKMYRVKLYQYEAESLDALTMNGKQD